MKYYVYFGYVNEELVYVGKGTRNRYQHLNSGRSSCYQANKLHFSGGSVKVEIVKTFEDSRLALDYERTAIENLKPAWNIVLNPDSEFVKPNPRPKGIKSKKASSSYQGVSYNTKPSGGKYTVAKYWRATYNDKGVKRHIGNFETEIEAAMARDNFVKENNLDLPLNFP